MKRIFFIAGEASGDAHASEIVTELKVLEPEAEVHAYGGLLMEQAGAVIHYPLPNLTSVGLDWIRNLFEFRRVGHQVPRICGELGIKTLVLVDFPGFNLRVATVARRAGLRVLYYITPQVWAWRAGRVKRMRRDLDGALVIFPFEEVYLRERGIEARFVGHPLVDRLRDPRPSHVIREEHGLPLSPETHLVGLLPGSRPSEVRHLGPVLFEVARTLSSQGPNLHFVVPRAKSVSAGHLREIFRGLDSWTLVENPAPDLRAAFRASITKSGTSTLENAILGVPQVIVYKGNRLDAWIARRLIRVPWLGLVNILAGKEICREYLQEECTPDNIVRGVLPLIQETEERKRMLALLAEVARSLGEGNSARRAAEAIRERWV